MLASCASSEFLLQSFAQAMSTPIASVPDTPRRWPWWYYNDRGGVGLVRSNDALIMETTTANATVLVQDRYRTIF